MRRELKVGVLVTLSVALIAAVFVGRAFSTSDQQFTRLETEEPVEVDVAERDLPPRPSHRQDAVSGSAQPAEADPASGLVEQTSPDDELERLLDNLASGRDDVQPARRNPLPTPPTVSVNLDNTRETAARQESTTEEGGAYAVLDENSSEVEESSAETGKETASTESQDELDSSSLIDKWIAEMNAEEASAKAAGEDDTDSKSPSVSRSDAVAGTSELDRLLRGVGESPTASIVTKSEPEGASRRERLDNILGLGSASGGAGEATDAPDTYTVRHGDSFWLVAKKFYGKGYYWRQIAAANPGIDPLNLPEGKKLHIPPLEEPAPTGEEVLEAPPGAGSHVVQRGENLWDIASEHYGKGWRWKLIAQANPQINPHMLSTGTVLVIPDEEQALRQTANAGAIETLPLPEGFCEHVVQPYDKLWNISRKYYGSGTLYRTILAANPDVNDAHNLPVGKVLLIPPKPEAE